MSDTRTRNWHAAAATLMSMIACYGTLAALAVLGALGVSIALNEAVWAGAIVLFAGLALGALVIRWRAHRQPIPVGLGLAGFALIAFAMTVSYNRLTEIAGFILLIGAVFLDWRIKGSGADR